jgi:signal transduction histidine kinase
MAVSNGRPTRLRTLTRALSGIRLRAALAATLVVAVVLGVSAVAFVVVQRHDLRKAIAGIAEQRVDDIAEQVSAAGTDPHNLPRTISGESQLVQIIDARGRIVSTSRSLVGRGPLTNVRVRTGHTRVIWTEHLDSEEQDPYVIVVSAVRAAGGVQTIVAAQNLEAADAATAVVIRLIAIGLPLIVVLVALISYWLTGRALAPVTAMRRQAAEIGAGNVNARVPVPPAGDEISRLAETLNAMLQRLQTAAERQRRFVADASHELRSPLTTIRAAHEIALAHPSNAEWKAMSVDVLAETDRLDQLVGDLLLLARVDESGLDLAVSDVDLDDLVAFEVHRLRRLDGLEVRAAIAPVRLRGDRNRLSRLVRNVTDNAAAHAHHWVEFTLTTNATSARLEVGDDGPGVPDAQRERIFDRFVRLDESRQRGSGGTGLGLSIAREIATAHGGTIVAAPSLGGALFVVTLPLGPP